MTLLNLTNKKGQTLEALITENNKSKKSVDKKRYIPPEQMLNHTGIRKGKRPIQNSVSVGINVRPAQSPYVVNRVEAVQPATPVQQHTAAAVLSTVEDSVLSMGAAPLQQVVPQTNTPKAPKPLQKMSEEDSVGLNLLKEVLGKDDSIDLEPMKEVSEENIVGPSALSPDLPVGPDPIKPAKPPRDNKEDTLNTVKANSESPHRQPSWATTSTQVKQKEGLLNSNLPEAKPPSCAVM